MITEIRPNVFVITATKELTIGRKTTPWIFDKNKNILHNDNNLIYVVDGSVNSKIPAYVKKAVEKLA